MGQYRANEPERIRHSALGTVLLLAGGYLTSLFNYLLFHTLVEMLAIAIGASVYAIAWNTRRFMANDYLKVVGIGYLACALVDLLHTLAFNEMNVFTGYGTQLTVQLWTAARYLQAGTLFAAAFFIRRRIEDRVLVAAYVVIVAVIVALVFSGNFPDCYVKGIGQTRFKIVSEYAISATLLASLWLLYRSRAHFDHAVHALLVTALALTAASEILFTFWATMYDVFNMAGHLLKVVATYFMYRALVVIGLNQPFDLIFRDLKQTQEALLVSRNTLEDQVRKRTAALELANRELAADIAARKQAEETLRESEAKYRRIVDTAAEGIWLLGPDARTLFVNARMAEMLGYASEEIVGRPVTDFMLDEDAADHRKRMEARRQGVAESYERRFRRKDGRVVWTFASATAIVDDEHRFGDALAMFTDITERKHAEDAVHQLNQELERRVAERTADLEHANRELEAFSYSVSHDLRAPLRAIDGFSCILTEDYADRLDEGGRRYLDLVHRNVLRMGNLIDDILEFSRTSRREMAVASVNMAALTQEVFDELRNAAPERRILLRLGELPPARGDRTMIRQVLVNLLANAVKFTARRAEAVIEVEGRAEGDGTHAYRVRDNGAGFDMRYADKLFGVFRRLHDAEEFQGTGIGLAIVKRVVERHGGRVWAEGKVGAGASFYFTLPRG